MNTAIPALVPVWLVTQRGFLNHGLMLPPGSRALFDPMHLCPVYLSPVVAAFIARGLDDGGPEEPGPEEPGPEEPWILSARALLTPEDEGTSGLMDAMTAGRGRLARWAQMICIGDRVRSAPAWSAAKRVDTAIVAALERIGTLPVPPIDDVGEHNWFRKDEHRDDRVFVDWADRFFTGGDSDTNVFNRCFGFSSRVTSCAVSAARNLSRSTGEREANRYSIEALEAFVGPDMKQLARTCQIIDETFEVVPQRASDAARRLGGGVG